MWDSFLYNIMEYKVKRNDDKNKGAVGHSVYTGGKLICTVPDYYLHAEEIAKTIADRLYFLEEVMGEEELDLSV